MKAELIDVMGDDLTVVNAARVSFDKASDLVLTKINDEQHFTLSEADQRLIAYLAKHGHWTPFAHPQITIRETVPIFVARQRFKHMIGFVYNEISRRYVDDEPEFFTPTEWRLRPDGSVKQGSSDETLNSVMSAAMDFNLNKLHTIALRTYNDLLECNVAPEQARMVLPQSMYTSYYVTGSLAAWARMYKQRIDEHAQREIQDLARMVGDIIEPKFPISWEALTDA